MKAPSYVRPTRAIIHLGGLRRNFRMLESLLPPETRIMPVVKANGYGHGSFPIAFECMKLGAAGVCVADVAEAIVLRRAAFEGEILCLGALHDSSLPEVVAHDLIVALYASEQIPAIESSAALRKARLRIHVKVDTGMHRLGIDRPEWARAAAHFARSEKLELEGIFTHLIESDSPDPSLTDRQLGAFGEAAELFESAIGRRLVRHAANSGAILGHAAAHFDWVRPGLALYGYPPAHLAPRNGALAPFLEWRAPILQIRRIAAGEFVGYNRSFCAEKPTTVATIAIGYGDGYRRSYGKTGVGFRGVRRPVLGNVCMDLTMIDVTPFSDVRPGEEVTLLDPAGKAAPDARELAEADGTVPYEVLTGISSRVSRELKEDA